MPPALKRNEVKPDPFSFPLLAVMKKVSNRQLPGNQISIDMIRTIWWISVSWLALALVALVWFFVEWVCSKGDPLRYETALVSSLLFLSSLPAALGVLVAAVVPKTGLSPYKRVGGIALLLFCVGILILHDYLQAKYR